LGERAGNAALEEIVMAVKTRHDVFGVHTGIDAAQIVPTSKLVSTITGYPVQPTRRLLALMPSRMNLVFTKMVY